MHLPSLKSIRWTLFAWEPVETKSSMGKEMKECACRAIYYRWCPKYAITGSPDLTQMIIISSSLNTLRLRQNGRHFADNLFKCLFLNDNVRIFNTISLKFVPKGLVKNIPALVQIMAWHWPGNKPLSEPMMVNLLTHICATWPQWVKRQRAFSVNTIQVIFRRLKCIAHELGRYI